MMYLETLMKLTDPKDVSRTIFCGIRDCQWMPSDISLNVSSPTVGGLTSSLKMMREQDILAARQGRCLSRR